MPSFSDATQAQRASTVCDMDVGRPGRRMSFSYSQHGRRSNDANKRRQVQTMDLTMLSGWRDLPLAAVCNDLLVSTGTVCPAQIPPSRLASIRALNILAQPARDPVTAAHETEPEQLLRGAGQLLSSSELIWQETLGMFQRQSDGGPQSAEGSFLLQTWPCPIVPQNLSARHDPHMARSLGAPIKMELADSQVGLDEAMWLTSVILSKTSQQLTGTAFVHRAALNCLHSSCRTPSVWQVIRLAGPGMAQASGCYVCDQRDAMQHMSSADCSACHFLQGNTYHSSTSHRPVAVVSVPDMYKCSPMITTRPYKALWCWHQIRKEKTCHSYKTSCQPSTFTSPVMTCHYHAHASMPASKHRELRGYCIKCVDRHRVDYVFFLHYAPADSHTRRCGSTRTARFTHQSRQ